ncbi:MAG: phosphoenolpyruvate--protein phosphotransferase [Planctomycetota bacterium]|nr:MAG: phosphoenolpyruvate--protein phosphotransferase [Planctomycetota bacterium]
MAHEIKANTAAPGIAIAKILHMRNYGEFIPSGLIAEGRIEAECLRFDAAVVQAAKALELLMEKLRGQIAEADTDIYHAQLAILQDPGLRDDVASFIRNERLCAEGALQKSVARFEQAFRELDHAPLRERASDIRDVGRQLLNVLLRREQQDLVGKDGDYVLAVDEFLPSDLGSIETEHVRGILMGEGGKYSHGAILAKSIGIPCLVGLGENLVKLPTGALVILDGDSGRLLVDPEPSELEEFERRRQEREAAKRRVFEVRLSEPITKDGVRIDFYANVENLNEIDQLETGMFKGIGLFRTEFAFMERLQFPSEQEQFKLYRKVLQRMGNRRVTFRTLDVGGDKPLQYFRTPAERNPVLGWRGVRLTLSWPDIMFAQLKALVRASSEGPVQILLPMVTSLDEIVSCRRMLDRIKEDLQKQGEAFGEVSFGAMIEVPALAMQLEALLKYVDFLSIGSNDLAQYLLAVDRDNPRVAGMYDPWHPGVLEVLHSIVRRCNEAHLPCSLCGEVAGDTEMVPLLIGMGFRKFSMAPVFLPQVKLAVRSLKVSDCEKLWEAVRDLHTGDELRARFRELGEELGLQI